MMDVFETSATAKFGLSWLRGLEWLEGPWRMAHCGWGHSRLCSPASFSGDSLLSFMELCFDLIVIVRIARFCPIFPGSTYCWI